MYVKVPIEECRRVTGRNPLGVRWVDVNKEDELNPNYRSRADNIPRPCANEMFSGVRCHSKIEAQAPTKAHFGTQLTWNVIEDTFTKFHCSVRGPEPMQTLECGPAISANDEPIHDTSCMHNQPLENWVGRHDPGLQSVH